MELMENLDQSLATLVDKLQTMGFEQAPEVIEGAVRAIPYTGITNLIAGGIWGLVLIAFLTAFYYGTQRLRVDRDDNYGAAFTFIGGIGTIISGVATGVILTNGNTWLRVLDPQAYFYKQIVNSLL